MLVWGVAVFFCLFPVSCRLFSVRDFWGVVVVCRLIGLFIHVLVNLKLFVALVVCWILIA